MSMDRATFHKLLAFGIERGVSDIHFEVGYPPHYRLHGELLGAMKVPPLAAQDTEGIARMILEDRGITVDFTRRFAEIDVSYALAQRGRFRASIFRQCGAVGIVMRLIPIQALSIEQLNLPPVIAQIADARRGLVLVTGATGNGKTTTMAAMLRHINETRHAHIVTIEDPIEFLHTNKRSIVNQREVGIDTKSYSRALRGVVRAAPDVILIGEISDRESMEAAINLAGTGHLVLATLHANNCAESLDRIINMFPREQHNQIFLDMSQYLRAILAQRLVMGRDGKRVAAVEVMINTPHIQELVKKGDVVGIKEAIAKSGERDIQSFDVSLHDLYKQHRVELEEALANADSRANLEAKINFG